MSIHISSGTTDDLEEGSFRAEKSYFFGIEDRDKGCFWEIKPFSEEIDSDDHIDIAESKVTEYFEAFKGFDLGVEVSDFESIPSEVFGEIFTRSFRERGDDRPLIAIFRILYMTHDGVDHELHIFDRDLRIKESGRSDHLLRDHLTSLEFEGCWSR